MKSCIFKVVIEPDKFEDGRDAWHAFCPALKGCHTWGRSTEEALANVREAIDLYDPRELVRLRQRGPERRFGACGEAIASTDARTDAASLSLITP